MRLLPRVSGLTAVKALPWMARHGCLETSARNLQLQRPTQASARLKVMFASKGTDIMAGVDPRILMWTRACEMIDRAEQLHRQFIRPAASPVHDLSWEPPVDITETTSGILITVALPGVDSDAVTVSVEDDGFSVVGFRPRVIPAGSLVHRLEIPYGKFERRIAFPAARFRLGQSELANGCLTLKFSKQLFMEERIDV
jgi:HSP20 family molecular chaperone IbpA